MTITQHDPTSLDERISRLEELVATGARSHDRGQVENLFSTYIWHFHCFEIAVAPFHENWIAFAARGAESFDRDLMYFGEDGRPRFMPPRTSPQPSSPSATRRVRARRSIPDRRCPTGRSPRRSSTEKETACSLNRSSAMAL
jgi:hypothetical protein